MGRDAVAVQVDGQVGVLDDAALHIECRERRAELQRDLELLAVLIAAGVGLEGLEFVLQRSMVSAIVCRSARRRRAGAKAVKCRSNRLVLEMG